MAKKAKRAFRLDDVVRERLPLQLAATEDGRHVAMAVTEPSRDMTRNVTRVWLLDASSDEGARPVTTPDRDASLPKFSPDGSALAYLAEDKDGKPQVTLLRAPFAEPVAVTSFAHGVNAFEWRPDGRKVLVVAPADLPKAKKKSVEGKDDAHDVVSDGPRARMWLVVTTGGKPHPIGPSNAHVTSASWSPDGKRIAFTTAARPDLESVWHSGMMRVLDVGTGRVTTLRKTSSPTAHAPAAWSPNGWRLVFIESFRPREIGPDYLHVIDLATRRMKRVAPADQQCSYAPHWLDDDTIIFEQKRGVRMVLMRVRPGDRTSTAVADLPGFNYCFALAAKAGKVFFSYTEGTRPAEVYEVSPKGAGVRQLTNLNRHFERVRLAPAEVVRWKSREGWTVEGLLYKPSGRTKGPWPTIVVPHGGPHWASNNAFDPFAQPFVEAGYAVFLPNFRGSTGYGERFYRSIHRNWGHGPADDILRGVKMLSRAGVADMRRLALFGGSYGGYITAWLIGHTRVFRAAVAHAPVVNNVSMWGTTDIPPFMEWSLGGNPLDNQAKLWELSPVKHLGRARTPTLVTEGERDARVPFGQAQELFRTLKAAGAETAFVVYPREGHGITEPRHRIDFVKRSIAWFRRHLAGATAHE